MIVQEPLSEGLYRYYCPDCGWEVPECNYPKLRVVCRCVNPATKSDQIVNATYQSQKIARSVGQEVSTESSNPIGPTLIRKIGNFSRAALNHAATGFTKAPDEVVDERFAICQSNRCGLFGKLTPTEGICLHKSCGCSLRAVGVSGKNKLRWAEQKCPANLWGAYLPPDPVK